MATRGKNQNEKNRRISDEYTERTPGNTLQGRYLEGRNGRIWFEEGGQGSPLVLVHGGGPSSARLAWQRNLVPLTQKARILAPDLPGFGRSDPLPRARVKDFGRFLLEFLDRVKLDRVSLIGLSLGGAACLWATLSRPERVNRLILVAPLATGSPVPMRPLVWAGTRFPAFRRLLNFIAARFPLLISWGLRYNIHDRTQITPDLIQQVAEELRRSNDTWTMFLQEEARSKYFTPDLTGRLPEISCPVLLIHGEYDRLVPVAYSIQAHRMLAQRRLEIIPGCGHWVPWERHLEFNALVTEFLSDFVSPCLSPDYS